MSISILQIGIIVLVLLLLFGAGKLPRLMGDMAAGIKAFQKGMKDDEPDVLDKEAIDNEPSQSKAPKNKKAKK